MNNSSTSTLVDGHVHIYDCFELSSLLEAAFDNFGAEAVRRGHGDAFVGVLLLTESAGINEFSRLRVGAATSEQPGRNGWRFRSTGEDCSLIAQCGPTKQLILVAGRQIVTAEDLEILALCTDANFPEGLPLDATLDLVQRAGGMPAIPWGAGKWLGKRGAIVRHSLESQASGKLFLGDNSGRPVFWGTPRHFELAQQRGIRVLPGTDPLPFASEYWRPGSFGFALSETLTPEHPAGDLKRLLVDPSTVLSPYGSLENPYRFVRNQIRMQLRKRGLIPR
jgi:hypothetical protein